MTGTDATSGNKSGFIGDTFHLELCEGQILTRRDIDAVSLYTNQLIKRIRKLEKKLNIK